jgi:hypothetical protein
LTTYELLRKAQDHVVAVFPALMAARYDEAARRRDLLDAVRGRLRDQVRVARCVYGPLLREGLDPNLVLAAFESHAAVADQIDRMESDAPSIPCWLGAVTLLRCLVREHFEAAEAPLRRGARSFFATDPEVIAPTYSSLQRSAAVGSSSAWPTKFPGRSRAAAVNARAAASA